MTASSTSGWKPNSLLVRVVGPETMGEDQDVGQRVVGKAADHPVHQQLIVFPLRLLATAVLIDVLQLITDEPGFATPCYYVNAAGVRGGTRDHALYMTMYTDEASRYLALA